METLIRNTYVGKVVSARFSNYLTHKFGDKDANISGYTLHILIDKINGESINKHCFELQCYSDFVVKTGKNISYLHITKPLYEENGLPVVVESDIAVGESYVAIKGYGFQRKVKNGKEYRMLRTGLPLCVIKKPLISDIWLPDEPALENWTTNVKLEPIGGGIDGLGGLVNV